MNMWKYLHPQPEFDLTPETSEAFESLLRDTPQGCRVDYRLTAPKWQFLSFCCLTRNFLLHGSQYQGLHRIEPRKARDVKDFSDQEAIYATTDGIWAIFFAITDRQRFRQISLFNSCLSILGAGDQTRGPFYFFSVSYPALVENPWCCGTVYILPRDGFQQEPAQSVQGAEIVFPHWSRTEPVNPKATMDVRPQDFPFLAQVHGHDDEKLSSLARLVPDGFPWPEALVS